MYLKVRDGILAPLYLGASGSGLRSRGGTYNLNNKQFKCLNKEFILKYL